MRRYRPPGRNRPRYDEYDDYEYDDRPYRRNRDPEYRIRDHDYDRDKPYRSRDFDYDRPRNRERIRDDDRPIRSREVEDRPSRSREDDWPIRSRDEERSPVRNRDSDQIFDERSRNRNDQSFRSDAKISKSRSRETIPDNRHYYAVEDERYREREVEENKKAKDIYRDEPILVTKAVPEKDDKAPNYKDDDEYKPQIETDKYSRGQQDRSRNPERPSRFRESLEKFAKSRTPSREVPVEEEFKKIESYSSGRSRTTEQTERPAWEGVDRGTVRSGFVQRTRPQPPPAEVEGLLTTTNPRP